jgi:spore maturation protein CgeB
VLTELRNRGIITAMWFVEDCRRFSTWKEISRYYDYMFIIQDGEYLDLIERSGAGRAHYLPVGCDPVMHKPLALTPEEKAYWGSEVSFLGAGFNNRQHMFARLADHNFKIWGNDWPNGAPFNRLVQEKGQRIEPEDYVKIFNASTINLNLHSSAERDGVEPYGDFINPRTFELAATGAFQLVDERTLLPEVFEIGSEVITFKDQRELEDKIKYYLARPEERNAVTQKAQARALRDHTYEARLKQMLKVIYEDRYEELSARTQNASWPRVLKAAQEFPELHGRCERAEARGDEPVLDSLLKEISTGKEKLAEDENILLFMHHVRSLVQYLNELRSRNT